MDNCLEIELKGTGLGCDHIQGSIWSSLYINWFNGLLLWYFLSTQLMKYHIRMDVTHTHFFKLFWSYHIQVEIDLLIKMSR